MIYRIEGEVYNLSDESGYSRFFCEEFREKSNKKAKEKFQREKTRCDESDMITRFDLHHLYRKRGNKWVLII